jgi:hypothetical protein
MNHYHICDVARSSSTFRRTFLLLLKGWRERHKERSIKTG